MNNPENKTNFITEIECKELEFGQIYARYNIGLFFKNKTLTFANSVRRILLTNIPGYVLTEICFSGIEHEFDIIPGVKETVFDIIENFKQIIFLNKKNAFDFLTDNSNEFQGSLVINGPCIVTAGNLKLPPNITCLLPSHYIASLSWDGELKIYFKFKLLYPNSIELYRSQQESLDILNNNYKTFYLQVTPNPIKQVNYSIQKLGKEKMQYLEYIVLDIITDGSIQPILALKLSILQLTNLFYSFISNDI